VVVWRSEQLSVSALPDRLVIVGPRHQPREQTLYSCRDTGQVFSEDGETAKGSAVEKCWYCSTSRPVCEDDYTHRLACGSLPMPWQTDDHYTQIWRRCRSAIPVEDRCSVGCGHGDAIRPDARCSRPRGFTRFALAAVVMAALSTWMLKSTSYVIPDDVLTARCMGDAIGCRSRPSER
jgi:hypothetical protein